MVDFGCPRGRYHASQCHERSALRRRRRDGIHCVKPTFGTVPGTFGESGTETPRGSGREGGNPRLRARDPDAIRELVGKRDQAYFEGINSTAAVWLPVVRRLRPQYPWQDVVRALNARMPAGEEDWTVYRLKNAVKRFVREGLAEPALLGRAQGGPADVRLWSSWPACSALTLT